MKKVNRREFIGQAAAGAVSFCLGMPLMKMRGFGQGSASTLVSRTLGRSGLRIPVLSFGVMNTESPGLLNRALDLGINHLDTAWAYLRGNSERAIGRVLQERKLRDKVYVATKMRFARDDEQGIFIAQSNQSGPGATEENFHKQLAESLDRLRSDYVDILYLHSCYSPAMANSEPLLNLLVKAKQEGKARLIGTSTHRDEANVIRATADAGVYDVVLTAFNHFHRDKVEIEKAIRYAAEKGVGVIAMKTQGGVPRSGGESSGIDHRAALKWVLNNPDICTAIPGMTSFEQLEQNFRVMTDLSLASEDQEALLSVRRSGRSLFCHSCRSCTAQCPRGVDIPRTVRAFMYAEGYGNIVQARATLDEIAPGKGPSACRDCRVCVVRCPNGHPIRERVGSLERSFRLVLP